MLSQIKPPAMLALRHWVLDTNTKINFRFTILSRKQTRRNIIKLKPSMHFVLKVVISQHRISWRRSGISHWSEMMIALLLVVDVVLWLYFWKMFYNMADKHSDKSSMSATSWAGKYGFTEKKGVHFKSISNMMDDIFQRKITKDEMKVCQY